ncbi:EamA family transporter [Candidatus Bipolaricaulota bacterium]|nr:EamA family transporter [Candidatus Bipolaricaulota bacterium]
MNGYVLATLAAIAWSSLGIWGSLAFNFGIDPLLLVTLRALIATIALLTIFALTKGELPKLDKKGIIFFSLFGFFGVGLNYLTYFYAIKLTSVSIAVILLYTYPAIVTLTASSLFKEKITLIKLTALLLTATGIIFVVGVFRYSLEFKTAGIILGLIAGITAAAHSLLTKFALRKYSSLTIVTYGFVFGGIFLTLTLLGINHTSIASIPTFPIKLWGIIVALAFIPTIMGYFLYTSALNYIEVSRASIVTTLEPVAAILLAYFVLSETLTPVQIAGAGLVTVGVLLVRIRRKKVSFRGEG